MGRAQPDPKFPDAVWDGLTRSTKDPNAEVPADIDFNARYRAEIRAIEEILLGYLADLEVIHNYGDPNDVLTVKDDGTGIEWAEGGGGDVGTLYTGNSTSILLAGTPVYHAWTPPPFVQDTRQSTCDGNYLTSRVQGVVYEDMTAPGDVIVAPDGVTVHRDDWTPITGGTTLGGVPGAPIYLHTNASAPFFATTYGHVLEGQYLTRIGYAITQYDLMVATGFRIQL